MSSRRNFLIIGIVIVIGFILVLAFHTRTASVSATPVRIGWQTPWATQGQLVEILKHTDILKKNAIDAAFLGFSSGAPLNEAALAGDVDIIFTADQPAATLLAKSDQWSIVGRLMYNRVSLYVPPKSPIHTVAELKGKTVAMPFGAAAQRFALKEEQDAGLNPKTDVNNVNLGIYEQSDLVRDPNATAWGNIDAMAGFDPTPAIFEEKGLVRNLGVGTVVSVIMVSNDFIKENPAAVSRFLKSFSEAYSYYRDNQEQADAWFVKDSGLSVSSAALSIAASVESNLATSSPSIRIGFTDADYSKLQSAADFIFSQGLVTTHVEMKDHIDTSFLTQAGLE